MCLVSAASRDWEKEAYQMHASAPESCFMMEGV